ncbi:hypothetical protein ACHAPX_009611 [Trichoderma viride]
MADGRMGWAGLGWAGLEFEMEKLAEALALGIGAGSHAVPAPGGTHAAQASRGMLQVPLSAEYAAAPRQSCPARGKAKPTASVLELQSAPRTQKTEQLATWSVIALRQPEEGHRKRLERGASFGPGLE